jgi:ubiquinone/menaquinone biosynthesis C-methylase UbiE
MSQEDVFLASEGDNYFKRNRDHLGVETAEPLLLLMERHGLKPKTILDIGCADGSMLARISQKWGSSWTGIEPGLRAVKEGQKKYKHLALKRGVASKIPLTAAFDLVIVNYVLHWVSREKLFLALTEIDRVTRFGGHLIIGDFFPDRPTKNPYHHTPRKKVWTYKADYAGMFTASGMYEQEGRIFFRHEGHVVVKNMKDVPSDHRGAVTLLKKIQ